MLNVKQKTKNWFIFKNSFKKKKLNIDKSVIENLGRASQWRSQKFMLGGARLKDNIGNKKLI